MGCCMSRGGCIGWRDFYSSFFGSFLEAQSQAMTWSLPLGLFLFFFELIVLERKAEDRFADFLRVGGLEEAKVGGPGS